MALGLDASSPYPASCQRQAVTNREAHSTHATHQMYHDFPVTNTERQAADQALSHTPKTIVLGESQSTHIANMLQPASRLERHMLRTQLTIRPSRQSDLSHPPGISRIDLYIYKRITTAGIQWLESSGIVKPNNDCSANYCAPSNLIWKGRSLRFASDGYRAATAFSITNHNRLADGLQN